MPHSVEPAKAQIKMLTGDMFFVEENPEEISQMLRGAYKNVREMSDLDAFQHRGLDRGSERLAVAKNASVAQAAYKAALEERPDRIVRLRIRARVIEERIP